MQEQKVDLKKFEKLPKFIAVEGPIGAGKTTLTKLLANSFGYDTFLEQPSENPFLPDFLLSWDQSQKYLKIYFLDLHVHVLIVEVFRFEYIL